MVLYTTLEEAKRELLARWHDVRLRNQVENRLGEQVPGVLRDGHSAFLFRFVKTPNFEFVRYLDLVQQTALHPIFIEYSCDRFSTRNQDKLHLGKMKFLCGKDKKQNNIIQGRKVLDIPQCDGKAFDTIATNWGENFIDFDHRLFDSCFGDLGVRTFDISCRRNNGNGGLTIYDYVFSLCVCHGILFESYIPTKRPYEYEREFVDKTIWPSYKRIEQTFGVRPLIVPLFQDEEEGNLFWQYYPSNVYESFRQICPPQIADACRRQGRVVQKDRSGGNGGNGGKPKVLDSSRHGAVSGVSQATDTDSRKTS